MTDLVALVTDGPCVGTYDVARATRRMVFTCRRTDGAHFALDLPDDVVEDGEDPFVYEVDGGVGFACGRGCSYRTVSYRYAGTLVPQTASFARRRPTSSRPSGSRAAKDILAWARKTLEQPKGNLGKPAELPPLEAARQEALF